MPTSKKLNDLQVIKMPKIVFDTVGNVNSDGLHIITKDDGDTNIEVYSIQQTDKLINDNKVTDEELNSAISGQIGDLKSKSLDFILYATDWVGNTYTVSHQDIGAESDGILNLAANVTAVQYEVAANASMRISSQAEGSITITAYGDIPSIDIPITLIILGVVGSCDPEYALIESPAFTGVPTAPTAAVGTNTHQIATTEFVQTAVKNTDSPAFTGTPTAPTPAEGDNSTNIATTEYVQVELDKYAPINSPAFTGTPTASTPVEGTNTNQIATTAFVQTAVEKAETLTLYMTLTADGWTGSEAPYTQRLENPNISADCDGVISFSATITDEQLEIAAAAQIRVTEQGEGYIIVKASGELPTVDIPVTLMLFGISNETNILFLDSPALTGTPTAPTADSGTNTTQIATTEFVQSAVNECKSSVINFTLYSSAWSNNSQTLTNEKITASGNGFIVFSTGISSEAMAAANESQITMSAQTDGSITITTNGTTPTVDIPITLIILP